MNDHEPNFVVYNSYENPRFFTSIKSVLFVTYHFTIRVSFSRGLF